MKKNFLYIIAFMAFSYVHGADQKNLDWFTEAKDPQRANYVNVQKELEETVDNLLKLHGASNAPHHSLDGYSPRLEISTSLAEMLRLSADILQNYSQSYCVTLRTIAALGWYAAYSGAYLLELTSTYWCPKEKKKKRKKK